jgi:cell division protein FtsB
VPRALPGPVVQPIKQSIAAAMERRSELRVGFTARRAVILAAVVCVLTLTVAGPVRTFFAQHTEMKQLNALEAALRSQIAELQQQKVKLADPAHIRAQARERLGFVMPGEVPYQVQLPPTADIPSELGAQPAITSSSDPWYTALWHTIADTPHGPLAPPAPVPPGG